MASVVGIPSQIASMSPAQFASLPPHLKLNHTKEMPNQFYMNTAVLNPRQAQSVGLGTGAGGPATRLFQPIRSRVVQPNIIPKRPLNSWMGFRGTYLLSFLSLPLPHSTSPALHDAPVSRLASRRASSRSGVTCKAPPTVSQLQRVKRACLQLGGLLRPAIRCGVHPPEHLASRGPTLPVPQVACIHRSISLAPSRHSMWLAFSEHPWRAFSKLRGVSHRASWRLSPSFVASLTELCGVSHRASWRFSPSISHVRGQPFNVAACPWPTIQSGLRP
jgi:hypothetical protein